MRPMGVYSQQQQKGSCVSSSSALTELGWKTGALQGWFPTMEGSGRFWFCIQSAYVYIYKHTYTPHLFLLCSVRSGWEGGDYVNPSHGNLANIVAIDYFAYHSMSWYLPLAKYHQDTTEPWFETINKPHYVEVVVRWWVWVENLRGGGGYMGRNKEH